MDKSSKSMRAIATVTVVAAGLFASSLTAFATPQGEQRREGRDVRQDTRQDSRQEKVDCRQENQKSNANCRQDKRQSKQDGRSEARDIKY
jgi:hypothetical protein